MRPYRQVIGQSQVLRGRGLRASWHQGKVLGAWGCDIDSLVTTTAVPLQWLSAYRIRCLLQEARFEFVKPLHPEPETLQGSGGCRAVWILGLNTPNPKHYRVEWLGLMLRTPDEPAECVLPMK